jgi:hypothetical protein
MDKLRAWKLFRTATRKKGFMLQLPFQDDTGEVEEESVLMDPPVFSEYARMLNLTKSLNGSQISNDVKQRWMSGSHCFV